MSQREAGTALVEFAIAASLLFLILFGIIEFGLIFKDMLVLQQAARAGVRSAALGDPVSVVDSKIGNSAPTLAAGRLTIWKKYSTDNGASFPYALADAGVENNAPVGSLIKVQLRYRHRLLTGYVVPRATEDLLTASMVGQREY